MAIYQGIRNLTVIGLSLLPGLFLQASSLTESEAEQQDYLQWMQAALSEVSGWDAWQERTGELPPDFSSLSGSEFLPDPLCFVDGRPVGDASEWPERREEILEQFQHYLLGTFPPKPPLDRVVPEETTVAEGYTTRSVRLEFGPGEGASVRVELSLPDGPGPFPALITPYPGGWAAHLVPRGYAAVGFSGNDFADDTAVLSDLYPEHDFATLPRRAWAVQLVVDYLLTLPEVDSSKIALYGYSRDGKMATIAAALDERIAAVIAGSTGVGGVLPWRLAGEYGMGEGLESTTMMFPHWFHPRMRFFAGHEDRLPVDANLLVAAIAPRACLMQFGHNDEVSNGWAIERTYDSAMKVYELLGYPERLGLLREPGFHGSISPEKCLDWLDIQFGRGKDRTWHNDRLFAWNFERWKRRHAQDFDISAYPKQNPAQSLLLNNGQSIQSADDWQAKVASIRGSVRDLIGEAPPQPPLVSPFRRPGADEAVPGPTNGEGHGPGQLRPDVPAWVVSRGIQEFGWTTEDNALADSVRLRFGNGLHGDLFFPAGHPLDEALPTVIWLHGYSYPLGYMWVYRRDLHPILALVKAGYAVFAFDQSGFGNRQEETGPFYDRYPHWSRLGRMVQDVSSAIDSLEGQKRVDPARIYALGYTLGGMVALHVAATDERLGGVVSVAGFTPMRTDTSDRPAGGIARFSHQRSLVPRLGLFVGEEVRIPYDYDEILAAAAPRPVMIVQPSMGRGANPEDVRQAVDRAREVYLLHDAGDALFLYEPEDYTRFSSTTQNKVIAWMKANLP